MSGEKKRTIRGEEHSLIVLKITGRDRLGRPSTATIGYDDTIFNLSEGDEFVTAFVPTKCVKGTAS